MQTTKALPIRGAFGGPWPKTASSSGREEARSYLKTSLENSQPLGHLPQIPIIRELLTQAYFVVALFNPICPIFDAG